MVFLLSLAAAAQCPEGVRWPGTEWTVSAPSEAQSAALSELDAFVFPPPAVAGTPTIRTNSTVIVHRGAILYERYANGFDAEMRHVGWSVTKSALSLMVGIAENADELSLSDSICSHMDVARQDNCGITIEHALTFTTGLRWAETYTNEPPTASSVANMLFGVGRRDAAAFVVGHAPRVPPGTLYDYSSGDSALLAAALTGAVSDRWGPDYLWSQLFEPIGMFSAQISHDAAGTPLGSSGLHATPRDFARMGYLALHNGCWDGEMLVADDWMARTTTVSPVFLADPENHDGGSRPGLSWWLNAAEPSGTPPWEGVPEDAFGAFGLDGQSVIVIPSHELVVVRTAWDGERFDRSRLMTLAMAVADAAQPVPRPPPLRPDPQEASP